MYCQVCGDTYDIAYYPRKRQSLCATCAADTPNKISRAAFDRAYWSDEAAGDPPEAIRREFYEDYLRSNLGFRAYVNHTTAQV